MAERRRGLVVVAHARSGSNSLVELLNLALPQPILNEPFNENFTSWSAENPNYRDRVRDIRSLDQVVDEIVSAWSALKMLTYQLALPLLRHLVLRPSIDVVFLRRRNLLETAVSNLIALQTNLWKAWDAGGPIASRYDHLEALPVDEVRGMIDWTRSRLDQVDEILQSRVDGRVIKLVYEDLYLAHPAEQAIVLNGLWAHLGVPRPTSASVSYYLNPAEVRMAASSTYGKLPNILEINTACGSDETGWITYL